MNRELINTLAKDNDKWRNVALKICGDYDTAQDLVQEMYLKFSKDTYNDYTEVSEYLVALVIRNEYMRGLKKKYNSDDTLKEFRIQDEFDLVDEVSNFEIDDSNVIYANRFKELPMRQQELILESYDFSVREIAERHNINYRYVHRQIIAGIKEVLREDFDKYVNSNLKYKKI